MNVIRGVALLSALVMGIPVVAADEVRQSTGPVGSPVAKSAVGAASGPTLLVAGTILAPPTRAAVIVVTIDQGGRETRSAQVTEGETVDGYRVVTVEPDRVLFEALGQTFTVRLGGALPPPPTAAPYGPTEATPAAIPAPERAQVRRAPAVTGASSRGGAVGQDSSPPPNADELREKAQPVLDALRAHPRFREKLEQVRPLIQQKLEQSRAAGFDPHAGRRAPPSRPPASE